MIYRVPVAALLICIGAPVNALSDGDPDTGRRLATEYLCTHCHGPDGNVRSTKFQPVPMLAGQPASYLVKEMQNYASGVREDSSRNARMSEMLRRMSAQDFEDTAAFYATQKRY
jgi:cytochrome c553